MTPNPLYILLISVHGLIRGKDLELGRDSDTGGQTKYVVELARALAERDDVGRVELLTRRVVDPAVSADYAEPVEEIADKARIIRLDAGPDAYIRKEELWDHLDSFADTALDYIHRIGREPDIIHSHYADAGYVGVRLAHVLGIPLVHTGHSLGRVKRRRLLATGMSRDAIEKRYNMARRINAEEDALASADLVIASTHNEIEEQYGLYDYYQPDRMAVIPPGTDLERFHPPSGDERGTPIAAEIARFLKDPDKPMILALSRPDERKNIASLVDAYGESPALQELANLVIIAGNRDDIREMESGTQSVLNGLLLLIDAHDLYGKVAFPKHHGFEEVPVIYRLVAASGGVFVNPALTEPFGLTLIEAAASGLPLVATEDGGPQDIIGNCRNGRLIDPLDTEAMAAALLEVLKDRETYASLRENGLRGVEAHYSWHAHAAAYLEATDPLVRRVAPAPRTAVRRRPMLYHDRAIFSDLDQNLLGDRDRLQTFIQFVRRNRKCTNFGIATGRRLESALKVMKRYGIPVPDVLITSVGTEIHYAPRLTADTSWTEHIDHVWKPKAIRRVLEELPGIELQTKEFQSRFKISYFIDPEKAPSLDEINRLLHQGEQAVNTILSFGQFLDIVPVRASKGLALRYFAHQWDIPLEHILVAGGSGADEDMMRGNTLGVVVANRHHEELSRLTDIERIYFAKKPYAEGILEAIDHYDFLGECRVPSPKNDAA
ncbi:MAG: HAD family hydrolase [Chromatiales bacterium]|jgi:sucrose-phosphate synthase